MQPATLPPFQSFSVFEMSYVSCQIQIFASYRDPKSGELVTQEFFERVLDGRSMQPMKPVEWKHPVPVGAQFAASAAGNSSEDYDIFWETWMEGPSLQALAITQEDPISVAIQPGDERIHTPVLGIDKKLRVFFWRKQGAGYSLYQHVFSGELKKKGTVVTEKILDIPYAPLFSSADPISILMVDKKGFEEKGMAVVGWLSSEGGNMRAHAIWIHGSDTKQFDSDPISGYKPHPNQRLGLYGSPYGSINLGWLMGRTDSDSMRVAEFSINVDQGAKSLRICENAFSGTKIHSAAYLFNRDPQKPRGVAFVLTETGNLYMQAQMDKPKKIRPDVPLTYDFPIFASADQSYEAKLNPDGSIFFDSPH